MAPKQKPVRIPEKGVPAAQLFAEMDQRQTQDARWEDGHLFGFVYHASAEHAAIVERAHQQFFHVNAISPLAFPSCQQFEAEVVSMAVDMFHGDRRAVGTMTSGGTESLLMCVKTYRDWARQVKPEVRHPEIVLPETAHIAFRKAAHYFGVNLVEVPVTPAYKVDLEAVAAALTPETILLVGSAYNYPKGVIDPIPELAALAKEHQVGLHVDGCLGGFVLPWLEKLGYDIPPFDFRVRGVTSMSADLHKFGFGAKGASLVLYRNQRYLKHQFFANVHWSGGIYISPAMAGSRPGAAIAACWASLKALGEEGFLEAQRVMKETADKLMAGINAIPDLRVLGDPPGTTFAVGSDALDVFVIGEEMEKRHWHMNYMQNPACLHFMVSSTTHARVADQFLEDLRAAVEVVKAHPDRQPEGAAALYGMTAKLPEGQRDQMREVALGFLADQYRL